MFHKTANIWDYPSGKHACEASEVGVPPAFVALPASIFHFLSPLASLVAHYHVHFWGDAERYNATNFVSMSLNAKICALAAETVRCRAVLARSLCLAAVPKLRNALRLTLMTYSVTGPVAQAGVNPNCPYGEKASQPMSLAPVTSFPGLSALLTLVSVRLLSAYFTATVLLCLVIFHFRPTPKARRCLRYRV